MPAKNDLLTIGEVAARSGLATSAIRFYEAEGLVTAPRTASGQRVVPRYVLRRLAFIASAQRVGLTLREIADALAGLPADRAPTKAAWARLSRTWQRGLDERIEELERLREALTTCIGCGCLSLHYLRALQHGRCGRPNAVRAPGTSSATIRTRWSARLDTSYR